MALPELDNLARVGKLKGEPAAANELAGLQHSGTVLLAAVKSAEIWRRQMAAEFGGIVNERGATRAPG